MTGNLNYKPNIAKKYFAGIIDCAFFLLHFLFIWNYSELMIMKVGNLLVAYSLCPYASTGLYISFMSRHCMAAHWAIRR